MKLFFLLIFIFSVTGCKPEALVINHERQYDIKIITPWEISSFSKNKLPKILDEKKKYKVAKCSLYKMKKNKIISECEEIYEDLKAECFLNIEDADDNEQHLSACVATYNLASVLNNEKIMEVIFRQHIDLGVTSYVDKMWAKNKLYLSWMTLEKFRPMVEMELIFYEDVPR